MSNDILNPAAKSHNHGHSHDHSKPHSHDHTHSHGHDHEQKAIFVKSLKEHGMESNFDNEDLHDHLNEFTNEDDELNAIRKNGLKSIFKQIFTKKV